MLGLSENAKSIASAMDFFECLSFLVYFFRSLTTRVRRVIPFDVLAIRS